MHSPVDSSSLSRPRRRHVARALVAGLAALAVGAAACGGEAAKGAGGGAPQAPGQGPPGAAAQKPPKPLPVQVVVVAKETATEALTATGELVPGESVVLVSELARRLAAIHADDGDVVPAGAVLFELDKSDLEAELARLRVQERYARAVLGRRDQLAQTGAVSAEQRDAARQSLDAALASEKVLEVQLDKTSIVAPFAGRMGLRKVSLGAWVGPTVPLATLYDLSTLKVDFRVPERYAPLVSAGAHGQAFTLTVPGSAQVFTGHVVAIEPRIDSDTRSVVVRGLVTQPAPLAPDAAIPALPTAPGEGGSPPIGAAPTLLPGMFASISLEVSKRDAVYVPAIAAQPSPTGTRVFVAKDGVAKEVPVELGRREPERIEILKGLAPGDRVIVTNLLRMKNGVPVVEVDRSAAPKPDARKPDAPRADAPKPDGGKP